MEPSDTRRDTIAPLTVSDNDVVSLNFLQCFTYAEEQYQHPLNKTFGNLSDGQLDIDSILIGVDLEALFNGIQLFEICSLHSKRGSCCDLKDYILLATVMGFEVYAKLTYEEKAQVCASVRNHGPPSRNDTTFVTGNICCNAYVFLTSLMSVELEVVILQAFGMKAPIEFVDTLSDKQVHVEGLTERVDVGVTVSSNGIPLFTCTEGHIYSMFYMCGYGYGSVCTTQGLLSGCRAVSYPTVLHHIKSLSRMPYNVLKLNKYVRVKEQVFKRMIRELIRLGPDLHWYRIEYQFRGRFELGEIIEHAKTMDSSLPPGVSCNYNLDHKTYCRFIQSYYRHCVRNGLFTGRDSWLVTLRKKSMLFQLYNTIGIWSYIMAPYVAPVAAVNLGYRSSVKNYRPISLLCILSKVLERLTLERIYPHIASTISFNSLVSSSSVLLYSKYWPT